MRDCMTLDQLLFKYFLTSVLSSSFSLCGRVCVLLDILDMVGQHLIKTLLKGPILPIKN